MTEYDKLKTYRFIITRLQFFFDKYELTNEYIFLIINDTLSYVEIYDWQDTDLINEYIWCEIVDTLCNHANAYTMYTKYGRLDASMTKLNLHKYKKEIWYKLGERSEPVNFYAE